VIVCLDAGHGGKDGGAVSGDLLEKNLNLELQEVCYSVLKHPSLDRKFGVICTRNVDRFVSIKDRAIYANDDGAVDVFISLHHNASSSHRAHGCEVLYYPHTSVKNKAYAEILSDKISQSSGLKNRGAKPGWYRGDSSKGILGILRRTKMPAYIIEAAFIDSSVDQKHLIEHVTRVRLYRIIAESILEVLQYAITS